MSGVTSWGIGCGQKDVPGVYADVSKALCFIDFATKCQHGNKYDDFYDYPQCKDWLKKEMQRYIYTYQYHFFKIQFFFQETIMYVLTILSWMLSAAGVNICKRNP